MNALTHDALLRALQPVIEAPCWWVALSGGLDSTVLLHALQALARQRGDLPPLRALHVNHQLHPDADRWQQRCERLCRALDVPLHCERVAVRLAGAGPEAAAREARHAVFAATLGAGEVLLSAHHQDDQVETVLLRLLRGAGVEGLAAMAAMRPLGSGHLYRPLLAFPRSVLAAYARDHALQPVEDPSNSDTGLDRNFLRHRVLPLLEERWPGYRQTVTRAAGHLRIAAGQLRERLPQVSARKSALGDPGLDLAGLRALEVAEAARVLRHWLWERAGVRAPGSAQLAEFIRQLSEMGQGARARLECGPVSLQCYAGGVYLLPGPRHWQAPEARSLAPGQRLTVPGVGRLALVPATGRGIALAAGESLSLCWRRGGERCVPAGRQHRRSLKKLLQEGAVPPWWRDRVPLCLLNGELVAVGDLWLCESSRLTASGSRWQVRWQRNSPGQPD